ncbi:MAG: ester cyclase, partial [Aquaticitalea sp.]
MKLKKQLIAAIALIGLTTSFAQQSNIDKDLKMYTQVWDDIVNKGEIDKINTTYFDENITGIASPENVIGIDAFKAYYQNYLTGFSDITFDIINVFGQGDNIVKHWHFKGTHTGVFFGIPATGNKVDVEGVTLVKMKNGRVLQEQ